MRLSFADWVSTAKHSSSIRILQARVLAGMDGPVLDATLPATTVAGLTVLNHGEQLQVAELFAGSFMGWTQAAYVIHKGCHPLRVRLLVDREASCSDAATFTHSPIRPVLSLKELCRALREDCNMYVVGDVSDPWWYKALSLPSIKLWCASPPCQPFSTAGRGPGLLVPDGQALLHFSVLLEIFLPAASFLH